MTPRPASRSPLYPILFIGLFCLALGLAAWSAADSPALASVMDGLSQPTPTPAVFARADVPKPTHTATPFFTPTPLPTETPLQTETPLPTETAGVMEAVIVADTPTLEAAYQAPAAAPGYSSGGGGKYILVDISEQHLYAYEGGTLVFSFVASTGINNATRVGTFAVQSKIPSAYGATWNIWMPNWLGIYWSGGLENGIHALPILPNGSQLWEGFLGRPVSYGCVVLGAYESQLLYDWAEIGTPVEIQW
ncbi:MAG: L,D-transpeptidase [Chloroflexota bacterium]